MTNTKNLDSETREVLDEMEKEGHEFEGVEPKEPKGDDDLKKKDEEAVPKEKSDETDLKGGETDLKDGEDDEKGEKDDEVKVPDRTPRKPEWVEGKEKREEKKKSEMTELREDVKGLTDVVKVLQESFNKPNKEQTPEQKDSNLEDAVKELQEKYPSMDEDFLKDMLEASTPKALQEKVVGLEKSLEEKTLGLSKIENDNRLKREDREYKDNFNESVLPVIKEEYPNVSDEDIQAIREKLGSKDWYFKEKYIGLDTLEIYNLGKSDFAKLISKPYSGGEIGKKGAGRGTATVDYSNVTDEQFAKMSPEEQDKVINYKAEHSKL